MVTLIKKKTEVAILIAQWISNKKIYLGIKMITS